MNPEWEPITDDLLDAVRHVAAQYGSFAEIPFKPLALRGGVAQVKRLLVPVRSKIFLAYVGRGRRSDQISIRRIRHPSQRSMET